MPAGWRQTQEQAERERDGAIWKVKWMEKVVQGEIRGLQWCLCVSHLSHFCVPVTVLSNFSQLL